MKTPNSGSDYGMDNDGFPTNGPGGQPNGYEQRALARRSQPYGMIRRQPFGADLSQIPMNMLDNQEKRRFNFADYVGLLWRGKWIILSCMAIAGLIAAYYSYSQPYVYRSALQVLINERDANISPLFSGSERVLWQPPERILRKELQILSSQPILEATAERIVDRRFLDTVRRDSVIPVLRAVEVRLGARLKKMSPETRKEQLVAGVASSIRGLTSMKPSKDADIIQIITQAGDPREAALITNVYARIYELDNQQQNRSNARRVREFLAEKLHQIRDSLAKQEMLLKNYREGRGIVGFGDQTRDMLSMNSKMSEEATATQIEISALTKKIEGARRQLRERDSNLAGSLSLALPQYAEGMQQQIAQLEVERNLVESKNQVRASDQYYNAKLKELDDQIASLRNRLRTEIDKRKNSYLGAAAGGDNNGSPSINGLNALRKQIFDDEITLQTLRARMAAVSSKQREIGAKMTQVPSQELDLERLERDKAATEKVYTQINEEYNRQMITEASVFSNVRVLEQAQADPVPVSPDRGADVITGILAGFGIGIGIVLLLAFIDTTIHTPEELAKHGFTMLTAIPTIREDLYEDVIREDITPSGKVSPHLITQVDPKSPIAEAYRSLRTGIQFASLEDQSRMLLFTSSTPQEGKSTTSVNNAIVFAQSGSKTLLIDCDLRRPILHSVFGVPKDPGLVNCLVGNISLDEAIYTTKIPNLDLLTSGSIPPNPSELLGSRPMRDLLDELRGRYDTIVLDSPPTAAVTDAVLLATLADITVVVVRAHKTKVEFLQKTRDALERVFVSPLGVVLNDFDVSQSYGSSYKYYRYYKYYGYYGNAKDGKAKAPGASSRRGRNMLER